MDRRSPSPLSTPSPALSSSPTSLSRLSSVERPLSATRSASGIPVLDETAQLQRAVHTVVKSRTGSVLSRGFILKTDHYPSGRALDLELSVHGAPNFRAPRTGNLNVFGTAQPRSQGLRAILSILRCRPGVSDPHDCVWFSTREEPIGKAENLEDIEKRLKNDILQESVKFGGLILTHNEVASTSDGEIVPTWTAVDTNNVKTSRELWESMKNEGWRVEDNYLDAYVRVIKQTDPIKTSLVFSCGMGAVRTTFAMVAALLVRRKQIIARGLEDPFLARGSTSASGFSTPTNTQVVMSLEQANAQQELSKSLLRLTAVLQQSLQGQNTLTAVELLLPHPALMESLRKALTGNYSAILSLLGCLDHGTASKRLADRVIDSCDHVVNLREEILTNRIRYSLTSLDEQGRETYLDKAAKGIEKYFFIIAFANYVEETGLNDFNETFYDWMKARTEIWNQVTYLRKSRGSRLNVFAPVHDLSALSKSRSERLLGRAVKNDVMIAGGQVLGDEYTDHVVKTRSGVILREGTLLKSDQWLSEAHDIMQGVRGASNFRNIAGTSIYALGQPSTDAIDEVVRRVKEDYSDAEHIIWITLREEPVVYINGAPYCLRREGFSLRNMKDYGGISASRLEVLEERLREDVVAELDKFGGRLLLHTEAHDGSVIPIWEDVGPGAVETLKEIMAQRVQMDDGTRLVYRRIPITSERPPDFTDLSDLMDVVTRLHSSKTPIVLNDQLGRGRSTVASIIILLIQQWLQMAHSDARSRVPRSPSTFMRRSNSLIMDTSFSQSDPNRQSYQVINNLLRVIRNGLVVKEAVDSAIDSCSEAFNLRDSIEEARINAEQATNDQQRKMYAQRGLHNLRRYFELIIFRWYLSTIEPDTIRTVESFESFVKNHPVIKTFEKELLAEDLQALKPLERVDLAEGLALPDEARQVVVNRRGSILSASTILKSDFFSNLQKMSLPERIEGSPNFRRVPLMVQLSSVSTPNGAAIEGKMVCGSGMPTVQGLRRALERVNADASGSNMVFWTSLREASGMEPVLYVAGRPHVLRLIDRPLENVEATGVTTHTVESMEINLKRDVIREVRLNDGRILLHDEVEERPGVFSIIPQWENVTEDDILTPRDVFDLMAKEGYKINYDRIAITDEQAPLPDALFQLYERVRSGLEQNIAGDFIFNCQMGRGRTTTGMVSACLVATVSAWNGTTEELTISNEDVDSDDLYDSLDGPSEEEAYLQGEYKIILQLVGVLSHGKAAKALTDRAIDLMQDVQNLRRAIYDYKLKIEALPKGSDKQKKLMNLGVNYLYGTLIVFANYLIELKELTAQGDASSMASFPVWLKERREITTILGRRTLA
ncbi:uncharacterized protein FOMMEDRAFT_75682 [Fomitiporia mediterranea MF3/22]|uniref:uncharacterized protein n=1 Tax=Fomitiporia mediterranea (strain MF3/22) TaxID=694068 RepID=UPI0004407D0B|nr:uncharacterized protein FOMMEDRAFT_75682 [Fomitiporia mediterranea MF3/22]EJD06892.1 hypothetical protein FOMMEDRAFT_75682 [Fomitiporia mediterranea MF3/22]